MLCAGSTPGFLKIVILDISFCSCKLMSSCWSAFDQLIPYAMLVCSSSLICCIAVCENVWLLVLAILKGLAVASVLCSGSTPSACIRESDGKRSLLRNICSCMSCMRAAEACSWLAGAVGTGAAVLNMAALRGGPGPNLCCCWCCCSACWARTWKFWAPCALHSCSCSSEWVAKKWFMFETSLPSSGSEELLLPTSCDKLVAEMEGLVCAELGSLKATCGMWDSAHGYAGAVGLLCGWNSTGLRANSEHMLCKGLGVGLEGSSGGWCPAMYCWSPDGAWLWLMNLDWTSWSMEGWPSGMLAPWHWFWLFKKRKLSAFSCFSTCMQHSPFPAVVEMAQRLQAAEYAIFCWFAEVFCSLIMLQHKLTIKACQAVVSLEAVGWSRNKGVWSSLDWTLASCNVCCCQAAVLEQWTVLDG